MVLTAVAFTMLSIEFLIATPINQYIQSITKAKHVAFESLRKDKSCIFVTVDKGVTLVVMDTKEYITKCKAVLQYNSVYQHLSKDTSPTIHKELIKILQD